MRARVALSDCQTFLKGLLALRQSGALHDRSKRLDWIKSVYQSSLADQFEDLSEPVLHNLATRELASRFG